MTFRPLLRNVIKKRKLSYWSNYKPSFNNPKQWIKVTLTGASLVTVSVIVSNQTWIADADLTEAQFEQYGSYVQGLKDYTKIEISQHNSPEKGVWVIYKNGVYDITKFVSHHPGGDNILLGAGGNIEPFWNLYASHKKEKIFKLLEKFRIGNLDPKEEIEDDDNSLDPYFHDPKRLPIFSIRSSKPFNAEPPLKILADKFFTPNDIFFIRNHLPVPEVDPEDYVLEIEGIGLKKTHKLTLKDLKTKFPKHSINATIQCAGNRRSEMNEVCEEQEPTEIS